MHLCQSFIRVSHIAAMSQKLASPHSQSAAEEWQRQRCYRAHQHNVRSLSRSHSRLRCQYVSHWGGGSAVALQFLDRMVHFLDSRDNRIVGDKLAVMCFVSKGDGARAKGLTNVFSVIIEIRVFVVGKIKLVMR